MFNEAIPPALRKLLIAQQKAKERLVHRRAQANEDLDKLLSDDAAARAAGTDTKPVRTALKKARAKLAALTTDISAAQAELRRTLRDCHKYEPQFTPGTNVAGDAMKLRMPSTRSGCYPHASRIPSRDDQ